MKPSLFRGLLLVLVLAWSGLTALAQISRRSPLTALSSPEGTVTTLVQDRQVLVYAPRAARAQKVIFDTPDRQLIYEPDTPFRAFFDGHSPDFADGKVDYAKATILKDVVNMLRNKEYVRLLVREVVERHQSSAINSDAPCGSVITAAEEVMAKRREVSDLLPFALPGDLTQQEFSFLREVDRVVPSLKARVTTWIQDTNIERQSERWKDLKAEVLSQCGKSAADDGGWRARHSRLLVDAISLELVNEQYPEMRDEDIEALFDRFTGPDQFAPDASKSDILSRIWRFTTVDGQSLEASQALVVDLMHTLRERQFFRVIIDRAVSKRANLFRSGGSAIAGLERFKSDLGAILKSSLEPVGLVEKLASRVDSPWALFMEGVNGTNQATRLLCADNRLDEGDRRLVPRELAVLSRNLRSALVTNLLLTGPKPRLTDAPDVVERFFSEPAHSSLLRPSFGTTSKISELMAAQRAVWNKSLTSNSTLIQARAVWSAALAKNPQVPAEVTAAVAGLKTALTNGLERYQGTVAKEKRIALAGILGRIDAVVPAGTAVELAVLVENLLPAEFPLELHSARIELVNRLMTLFQSYPRWIVSDASLFATILQEISFPFTDSTLRSKAVADLPSRFAESYKSNSPPASAEGAMATISSLCDSPAISYLFGSNANNASLIEAFKEEFYNAFKHRLSEALAAERDADYDYWWITFFPKAIPMGYRKLEGDSFIEIAFPPSAVPEEQFHRWLEDRTLPPRERSKNECRRDGEAQLELATSVVRDFQTVLESPWFAQYFKDLRPQLAEALQSLEREKGTASCVVLDKALVRMIKIAGYPHATSTHGGSGPGACQCGEGGQRLLLETTEDDFADFLTRSYPVLFGRKDSLLRIRPVEEELRDDLAKKDVTLKHVVFAVISAIRNQSPLPEKINLYSYAYLDLSRQTDKMLKLMDASTTAKGVDILSSSNFMCRVRNIIVNSYYSAYPDVPSREGIRDAFMGDPQLFGTFVYRWLVETVPFHIGEPKLRGVHATKSFDDYPIFSPDVRRKLIKAVTQGTKSDQRRRAEEAFDEIIADQRIVDQIAGGLFEVYYADLFRSMNAMAEVGRHPVPFDRITQENYQNFRRWGKLRDQGGIQIVEMLPASRDDLVAISISEGGVVARAAAQAEGSAAYDVNKLQMALRTFDTLRSQASNVQDPANDAASALAEFSGATQKKDAFSALRQGGNLSGYSLGAAAEGSVYARARAALAYSRRREYLNAAVTAAGRGDNFAKWVVRKSDLRSGLATPASSKRLTAAAHTGYPNGDQPFHLLVKVPRSATFTDWSGKRHILFNSAYAATRKTSLWKTAGGFGLVAKTPFALLNPRWWNSIEEDLVGTCYPFKWDVRRSAEQAELMGTPNVLAGTIWLDEMDKIRHSEVVAMLEAEDNFIRLTREAQSREIGIALQNLEEETKSFRSNVTRSLDAAIANQIRSMTNAQSRVPAAPAPAAAPAPSED